MFSTTGSNLKIIDLLGQRKMFLLLDAQNLAALSLKRLLIQILRLKMIPAGDGDIVKHISERPCCQPCRRVFSTLTEL